MNPYQSQVWTVRSVLARAQAVWKEEGSRSLFFKTLGEVFYRRLMIGELDLSLSEFADASTRHAISRLDDRSMSEFLNLRTDLTWDSVAHRIQKGHECFVLRIDGQIVHACWVVPGHSAPISYLECSIELGIEDIYVYEFYIRPEYRGRGLSLESLSQLVEQYRDRGYSRLIWAWRLEGPIAAGLAARAGLRGLGILGYWRFADWRKYFRCRSGAGLLPRFSAPQMERWHRHEKRGR